MEKLGLDWILDHDDKFCYQLLSRMKYDCEYYLGNGQRAPKHLWAGNVKDHIKIMKALWESFPQKGKPEWLSWEQIEKYEADMEENQY